MFSISPKGLLSVIVPVYNNDKYLEECIESIINQTYKNLEIILIDDGSTDTSGKICDRYAIKDTRIKVIHQVNQGAVHARINGLKVISGEYVTFVDSDDWIDLNLFQELMKPLINNKKIDMSISEFVKSEYCCEKHSPIEINNIIAFRFIYDYKSVGWSLCAKIYKAKLFKNIHISNVTNAYGEDVEFCWKILKRSNKIYYTPFNGYYYRQNPESMMHKTISLAKFELFKRLSNIFFDNEINDFKLKKIIRKFICQNLSNYIIEYLNSQSDCNSIKEYQKLLRRIFYLNNRDLTPFEINKCKFAITNSYLYKSYKKKNTDKIISIYQQLYKKSKNIFIYGHGFIGKDIARILRHNNLSYIGFVITEKKNASNFVFSFDEILKTYHNDCAFIIAMNEKNTTEVKLKLNNINYICAGEYSIYYNL